MLYLLTATGARPAMRHGVALMQQGPGFKTSGMSTSIPSESMRPDVIDLEAAAASQSAIDKDLADFDPDLAGGFGKKMAFVENLRVGDKKLAGDVGFDPLGLSDSSASLAWYREAEIKHARIAMLAAVGWPIAEKLNGPIAEALGQPSLLVEGGRTPSVLNGGLDSVSLVYWLAALGLAIAAESSYLDNQLGVMKNTEYVPGMVGFDPLGLDSGATRTAEIWLGRVAMIAVTAYAFEEDLTKAALF